MGDQTLYAAFSTGRTYNADVPLPYSCVRCNQLNWNRQGCVPQTHMDTGSVLSGTGATGAPLVSNNGGLHQCG